LNFLLEGRRRLLEWQCERISDPIERLRYLRQHSEPVWPWQRQRWKTTVWAVAMFMGLLVAGITISNLTRVEALTLRPEPVSREAFANVWMVDKAAQVETYSNGLRVETRNAISTRPRLSYRVYGRGEVNPAKPEWRSQPAGIVFHTTESDLAPFEAGQNRQLKRIGGEVLALIREKHSYHYMIDRFGRVFRVVEESDVANHAGNSIWADDRNTFVNLNASFLGVAFETQTKAGGERPTATQAQIRSGQMLAEMLRAKYHIPKAACVTHAQVSVNPDNMLIGYHTDWAGNFPFVELGLSDNYELPPASIWAFGFTYDPTFVESTGMRLWQGVLMAEDRLRRQAAAQGLPVARYRVILQQRYREVSAALKSQARQQGEEE
jgi:N-acetylmuramoyl-L-alanine amidase